MAWTKISYLSSGAPQLIAANGSLTAVLRWALPQLGWAIEYGTTGTAAVFRAAAGNRHRLCVNHNTGAAGVALVRGAHTATSATAWSNVFPTTGQIANANATWQAGDSSYPTTPVAWVIYGNDRFFYLLVNNYTYQTGSWDIQCFGDLPGKYNTPYDTVCTSRNTSDPSTGIIVASSMSPMPVASSGAYMFWARGLNGTTISTRGNFYGPNGSIGQVSGGTQARAGYLNKLLRQKVALNDCANTNTDNSGPLLMPARGWFPNLWNPMHTYNSNVLLDLDTFTDTAYNPAASFCWYGINNNYAGFIIEETDTWSVP